MSVSPLTFKRLREHNVIRCADPAGFNHSLSSWSPLEWAGAMCGEAGEAANVAKKLIRIRDGVRGNRAGEDYAALVRQLGREVADTVIYADLLLAREGQDLGEAIRVTWNEKSREIGWIGRL